jgi:hypothetical protein
MKQPGTTAAEALTSLCGRPEDSMRMQTFIHALAACGIKSAVNIKAGRDGGGKKMLYVRLTTPEDGAAIRAANMNAGFVFGCMSHETEDTDGQTIVFYRPRGAAIIWPVEPVEVAA